MTTTANATSSIEATEKEDERRTEFLVLTCIVAPLSFFGNYFLVSLCTADMVSGLVVAGRDKTPDMYRTRMQQACTSVCSFVREREREREKMRERERERERQPASQPDRQRPSALVSRQTVDQIRLLAQKAVSEIAEVCTR